MDTKDPTDDRQTLLLLEGQYTNNFDNLRREGGVGITFKLGNEAETQSERNPGYAAQIMAHCDKYSGGSEEYGALTFWTSDVKGDANSGLKERMCIAGNGNVGINHLHPCTYLHIHSHTSKDGIQITRAGSEAYLCLTHDTIEALSNPEQRGANDAGASTLYIQYYSEGDTHINKNGGHVAIGHADVKLTSEHGNLCIYGRGYSASAIQTREAYWTFYSADSNGRREGSVKQYRSTTMADYPGFSLYTRYGIWVDGGSLKVSSDKRIKENIVDVPDDLALEMLRNIPCCYYEYKDKPNRGFDKTIGFIAQDVKKVIPMAITIAKKIIPNEMRKLEIISWDEIIDGSNVAYKCTTDLSDCSGIKYQFYVSNDPSGNDEKSVEIVGNSDNTFTFEQSYNNIFCYGKEVDDFHTLDKHKLFALNFSATQELDKQQQADKAKIAELENEVATLKSELAAIKAHLGL